MVVSRFEVYLIPLDPSKGHEMKKTRPAVVVSPDEMNRHLETVIIAPMTTKSHGYPTRIPVLFQNKNGFVVLDQIRTVDKSRLVKQLGHLDKVASYKVSKLLSEMFAW